MQSFCKSIRCFGLVALSPKFSIHGKGTTTNFLQQTSDHSKGCPFSLLLKCFSCVPSVEFHRFGTQGKLLTPCDRPLLSSLYNNRGLGIPQTGMHGLSFSVRWMTTTDQSEIVSSVEDGSATIPDVAPRVKFKRPDKTAGHIMRILDKEAVEQVRAEKEIPDIQPGCIVQLKVEVPENKRRVSLVKGIVIARRNAGLNSTFRLRRMVAGVGVESVYPLYSPNLKDIKILERKKVRRAKLYYLRDKMNALKK